MNYKLVIAMFQVKLKSVYNDLTKSEKKIANFIMKNFERTKTMTSYDISKKVNVGQATVIRFSKKLGYSSFNELINSINKLDQEDILEKNISLGDDIATTNTKMNTEPDTSYKNYDLTAREAQILKLMTEGFSNMEIAQHLVISVNTTKAHVASILQKLEVDDRLQAALKALKYQIV